MTRKQCLVASNPKNPLQHSLLGRLVPGPDLHRARPDDDYKQEDCGVIARGDEVFRL